MLPETPRPVYFVALLRVPDIEAYRREYGRRVLQQVSAAGAKLLVASRSPDVLEGEWESGQAPRRGSFALDGNHRGSPAAASSSPASTRGGSAKTERSPARSPSRPHSK